MAAPFFLSCQHSLWGPVLMTLNDFPAYTEVVVHGGDEPVTGAVTAYAADRLVATAVRRGYVLDATAHGVIVIRRPSAHIVVELHPRWRPVLTPWQARDLTLLAGRDACLRMRPEGVIITAGLARIPPAATRRLLHRGWVACLHVRDGAPVAVSVAGRLALALHQHRTRTRHPRGWHFAADNPRGPQVVGRDRHGGRIYDGTSTAICSCGWSQYTDRRPQAAHASGHHRIESILTALTS